MPLGNFWLPLLVWGIYRRYEFVDLHGRESVNFQLSLVLCAGSFLPVLFFTLQHLFDGAIASAAVLIGFVIAVLLSLLLCLAAARRALAGLPYRYPLALRVF